MKEHDNIFDQYQDYVLDNIENITKQYTNNIYNKYKKSLEQIVIHNNENKSLSILAKIPTQLDIKINKNNETKIVNIDISTSKKIYSKILIGQWKGILNVARRPEILNFFKIDKKLYGNQKDFVGKYMMKPTNKDLQIKNELLNKIGSIK